MTYVVLIVVFIVSVLTAYFVGENRGEKVKQGEREVFAALKANLSSEINAAIRRGETWGATEWRDFVSALKAWL